MKYAPIVTEQDAKGLLRSKKKALCILGTRKFIVHNIIVGRGKKVALCDGDEVLHIITRGVYQKYITPELKFI